VQRSTASHTPAASRHTVAADAKESAGQAPDEPVQVSALSHGPDDARQTVDEGSKASAGHAPDEPVQVSAVSHGPDESRQTTDGDLNASAGQSLVVPSQDSATSHAPTAARQTTVFLPSGGQTPDAPVQASATSHSPAAGRHTAPAFAGACVHAPAEHASLVHGLPSSLHGVPLGLGGLEQSPVAGSHVPATRHSPLPPQTTGLDPMQVPAWQRSVCVHGLWSLQLEPSGAVGFEHAPLTGSQIPARWHSALATQTTGLAPTQIPA
jgi:hypothetical protein